ncbi:MAG: serine hydrolase domain-containing protein [Planctomycetota bacterium]|jgi:CubicO group peptidase (beta-lactamase class C family)
MENGQNESWAALCEEVAKIMKKDRVPGAALGVVNGAETFTTGFGVTNVDHPIDVTDETFFQVGSISKTFTATAIMKLVEEGKVNLDATARTYVPEFRVKDEEVSVKVTVRQLLTHVGGWEGDYFRRTGSGDDALLLYMEIMKEIDQLAPLGAIWSYNNAGFAVCGRIIELVTGKPFKAALEDLVLEPLGLGHCYLDHADVMIHRFVAGHNEKKEEVCVASPWPLPKYAWAAGGVMAHIKELLRYARFHMGDGVTEKGERLLKAETMEMMQTPQVVMWGENEAMGLSWFMKEGEPFRQIWHGGGTTGQVCMLHIVPERDFAVGILTNAGFGRRVLREAVRGALKHFLDHEVKDPVPLNAPEKDLTPLTGRYWRPYAEVELGLVGGRLICQYIPKGGFPTEDTPAPPTPPPWSMDLCEKERLIVLDGEVKDGLAEIFRKPDGSVGWLRFGGRIFVKQS